MVDRDREWREGGVRREVGPGWAGKVGHPPVPPTCYSIYSITDSNTDRAAFKFLKMNVSPCIPLPSGSGCPHPPTHPGPAPSLYCAALQLTDKQECCTGTSPKVNQETVAERGEKQVLTRQGFLRTLSQYSTQVNKGTPKTPPQAYLSSYFRYSSFSIPQLWQITGKSQDFLTHSKSNPFNISLHHCTDCSLSYKIPFHVPL